MFFAFCYVFVSVVSVFCWVHRRRVVVLVLRRRRRRRRRSRCRRGRRRLRRCLVVVVIVVVVGVVVVTYFFKNEMYLVHRARPIDTILRRLMRYWGDWGDIEAIEFCVWLFFQCFVFLMCYFVFVCVVTICNYYMLVLLAVAICVFLCFGKSANEGGCLGPHLDYPNNKTKKQKQQHK